MVRPREFNEEEVLVRVLNQFWTEGFHATSTEALEAATGLRRSSLYNAFGGKRELFARALDAYTHGPCAELHSPLATRRGADALDGYMEGLSAFIKSPHASKGCLMVNTTLEDIDSTEAEQRVATHFKLLRSSFRRAIKEGREDATLDMAVQPREGSDWLLAMVRGVMAGAAGGEKPSALGNALREARRHLGLPPSTGKPARTRA